MTEGEQTFVLLFAEARPIGFASITYDSEGCSKLQKIYVLPSTQGSGAGKFLLSAMEDLAKARGTTKMILNVNRYNKARSFYEKMGYRVVREEDVPIGPYWMNDYVLEKELV